MSGDAGRYSTGPREPVGGDVRGTEQARRTRRRRPVRAALLAVALAAPCLVARPASAQDEMDRQDLPERPDDAVTPRRRPPPGDVAPVPSDSSGRPLRGRGGELFVPEPEAELDPSLLPGDESDARDDGPSLWEEVKLKHRGRLRVGSGYDTNVFRSERDRTGDGFGRAKGEVGLLAAFPQGAQVFAEVKGESLVYFERDQANEHFTSAFLEAFHR
jgi:hypothetical protein